MRRIRTYHDVADPGDEDIVAQVVVQSERLRARLRGVAQVVVVASGKGGVGKSAVAANLAAALAAAGARVGAADADLAGPSLAAMLGAAGQSLIVEASGVRPAIGVAGIGVMSMDLLLAGGAPLRWKPAPGGLEGSDFVYQSTLEGGALREFLADTDWGTVDHLIIDAPPGTDKLQRLLDLLPQPHLLLLVTTPSEMARNVVARAARLAADAGAARVGLVANMTHHTCAACGHRSPLFEADGAARLAASTGLEVWAEVPFDARLALHTDAGRPFVLAEPDEPAARALRALARRVAAAQEAAPR